jgi:ribosomal protein L28
MAKKQTERKPLFGNKRSHAMNATKHTQKLNMQKVTLPNGETVMMSVREAKKFKNNDVSEKVIEEVVEEITE